MKNYQKFCRHIARPPRKSSWGTYIPPPPVGSRLRGRAVNTLGSQPKGPGFEPGRRPFFPFLGLPRASPRPPQGFPRAFQASSTARAAAGGRTRVRPDPCSTPGCCSRSGKCVDPLSHERVALQLILIIILNYFHFQSRFEFLEG